MEGSAPLVERLRETIRREGPISFARFMDAALYDPHHGYYAHGPSRLGPTGDFVTASDVGHAFGRCIARQIAEVDERAGPFRPLDIVEFGAGRGLLARDVLAALESRSPQLAPHVRYRLTDRSEAMLRAARREAPRAEGFVTAELPGAHRGVVLAVELFDALPVHRLRRRAGRLVEVHVDVDPAGRLIEVEGEPVPEARVLAERYGAARGEGLEAEVAPGVAPLLAAMAATLERGVIVIVDYGDRAPRLYDETRARGTLLAYHRHATNEDYLERVGRQDLTAHVNFCALEDSAREVGLDVLGLTTQDRFLVANGIVEEFEQLDAQAARDPRQVKRRLQAMQLIHPEAMGRRFKVLLLSKGCASPLTLRGLDDPFARVSPELRG